MVNAKKERLRKILLRREFLRGKRNIEKFLSDKTSFNEYFKTKISEYPDMRAVTDEYCNVYMSYGDLESDIEKLAVAIQQFGIQKGDIVCIFSENHGRWICTEQAVMRCGAIAALRGAKAPTEELNYILNTSEAKGLIVENVNTFEKIKPYLANLGLKFVLVMFNDGKTELKDVNCPAYYYDDAIKLYEGKVLNKPNQNHCYLLV